MDSKKSPLVTLETSSCKDRAAILAEREAKKLAKKNKVNKSQVKVSNEVVKTNISLDIQRKCENKAVVNTPLKRIPFIKVGDSSEQSEIKSLISGSTDTSIAKSVTKSNSEMKAERRAKQEAQRAAKLAATTPKRTPQKLVTIKNTPITDFEETPEKLVRRSSSIRHKVQLLFNHLYLDRESATHTHTETIHPAILRVGIQYQKRIVVGSNSRCLAMLNAIKEMILDHMTPPQEEYGRSLEATLQKATAYMQWCRPISVSMTNALRLLKFQLTLLPNDIDDAKAKQTMITNINTYIKEQIEMAAEAINITVQQKIADGDVILVYGCSSLIQNILLEAHNKGKRFRVVIVDSRPGYEGREMLRRLVVRRMNCTYVLISTTSFIMPAVSKVLLGAHALLANGFVMSRVGTAQIALMARAHNVPVLVCCETYKFCERVQTDAFVFNEIGDSMGLCKSNEKLHELYGPKMKTYASVIPLNLTYDVTPPDLVTAVVTEVAILPCTSVPVILRIKPSDNY